MSGSIWEEIEAEEEIQESFKFEISNRFVSEKLSYEAESKNRPDYIFKKLLFLSRKEKLQNCRPGAQKKFEVIASQIKKLKETPENKKRNLGLGYSVDPSLIEKLRIEKKIEEILDLGETEELEKENERLKKKLEEIEKKEFIKRQFFKLKAREIES